MAVQRCTADHLVADAEGRSSKAAEKPMLGLEAVQLQTPYGLQICNTHASSGNGQWRWAVLPLPSDYLMVLLVDEEKLMVAALRQVMWCVESLARAAF